MTVNKITPADLAGKGVIGLPDAPGLSTEEMQRKFEETAREVIVPKVNEVIDEMNGGTVNNANNLGGLPASDYQAADNKVRFFRFAMGSAPTNFRFSGSCHTRVVVATLQITGQTDALPPINISIGGLYEGEIITSQQIMVADPGPSFGISGHEGYITVPNLGGNWGSYTFIVWDSSNLNITQF